MVRRTEGSHLREGLIGNHRTRTEAWGRVEGVPTQATAVRMKVLSLWERYHGVKWRN